MIMRRAIRPCGAIVIGLLLVVAAVACSKDREPAAGATTLDGGVSAIVRGPSADDAPLTVLFLHGASYSSRIWDDRGILDDVAAEGYRAVAIDLPGYGDTPEDGPGDEQWLKGVIEGLGGPEKVVVVSPSMSGDYSLAYLGYLPEEPLAGFVGVAPVGIDEFLRPPDAPKVPALLVWGAEDDLIPRSKAEALQAQLPGSEIEVIDGGSHAPYDDHPDEFAALLIAFLERLTT
jgi:abhydrolase domain-containing protein 14